MVLGKVEKPMNNDMTFISHANVKCNFVALIWILNLKVSKGKYFYSLKNHDIGNQQSSEEYDIRVKSLIKKEN